MRKNLVIMMGMLLVVGLCLSFEGISQTGGRKDSQATGQSRKATTKRQKRSPKKTQYIRKAYMRPVVCECSGEHGNIFIIYTDGTVKQVTKDGLCADPKVASDRRTVGWLEGEHVPRSGIPPTQFQTGSLVLYRDGRILRRIETGMNAYWQFWKGSKQVAIAWSPTMRYSPFEYELRDVTTGRVISRWSDEKKRKGEKPPPWARALADP